MLLENLYAGQLLKRYRRFFVDVHTELGLETFHCPNTGSMSSLLQVPQKCWFSRSSDPKRKLKGTLEVLQTPQGGHALINTQLPNKIVKEWLNSHAELCLNQKPQWIKAEYPKANSRFDFGGILADGQEFVLEVKNVTLRLEQGTLAFPDAVTERGQKHLQELMDCHLQGISSHLFFLMSRDDTQSFCMDNPFDHKYQALLQQAQKLGVKIHLGFLEFKFEANHLDLQISHIETL